MASYLLSDQEPVLGIPDVFADKDAQQRLDHLVGYLVDPQPAAPFVMAGASDTLKETQTGATNSAGNDPDYDHTNDKD
ncbi:hypothetical protein ACFVUH_25145 [Kitasatospora sp. NPDC058032]|uniref:hypothetical protein n=1 Tax=Kitasatospora sp. NPDC058032 TaxID=3346307 RepID=UPI0036DA0E50